MAKKAAQKNTEIESMGIEELRSQHSTLLAQASDAGTEVPEELTAEFNTAEEGVDIVTKLTGLLTENKPAKEPAKTKAKKTKSKTAASAAQPAADAAEQETTVAKTAKKAVAKKAVAKKAVKAAKGKKAAAANARKPAGAPRGIDREAKITVKVDENPCRGGQAKRMALLMKQNGKTVEQAIKAGVMTITLRHAINKEWVSVK